MRTSTAVVAGLALVLSLVVGWWSGARQGPPAPAAAVVGGEQGLDAFGNLPLSFVENRGQTDPRVRYHGEVSEYAVFFTPDRVVMSFADDDSGSRVALALRFVGANPQVEPAGALPTDGQVNYLRGGPADHRVELPAFSSIVYPQLWPGIDMVFHGDRGQLKYEFRVRPGASPDDIRLDYAGATDLALDGAGALLIATPLGELRDSAPVSYQEIDGARVAVESRYALPQDDGTAYGFAVGAYEPDEELVIDPSLQYSTFLGGSSMDRADAMAVDADGNVVVAGTTQSTDFPTTVGAVDGSFNGGVVDVFVAKLTADGSGLVYATYLGGTPTPTRRGNVDPIEFARSVATDAGGNAYVAGQTSSGDFPTTPGAFQATLNVGEQQATDGFVAKLGPTGELHYSTFLGGAAGSDDARAIAVDGTGDAYVGGSTFSEDFPTTAGAFDTVHDGGEDVFVARLNSTGSALGYSTLLGGADNELAAGIAVDGTGHAYVAGSTRSAGFPATPDAVQPTHNGGATTADLFDVFVTKMNPDGSGLAYSTFLGGQRVDTANGIAIDSGGSAHVVGGSLSPDFPTTPGAFDTAFDAGSEGFVTKLDATGSGLAYSTFLHTARASAVTVDGAGDAWLAGTAPAGAVTTADAFAAANSGGNDGYLARLDAAGASLGYATYLGGTDNEGAGGIALGPTGDVFLAGTTMSPDFPTTAGALDRVWNGDPSIFWGDAFVARFDAEGTTPPDTAPVLTSVGLDPTSVPGGDTSTGSVTLDAAAPDGGVSVALSSSNTAAATVPASLTVEPGGTTATFPIATSSVTADTSVTVSATAGGVTRTAVLTVTAPTVTTETTTVSGEVRRNQTVAHTVGIGAGTVRMTLDWDRSRADLDLRVRDASGAVVFVDAGSARPKTGSFSAAVAGEYRFEVVNDSRRDTAYTLSVTHPAASSPPPTDTTAPAVRISAPVDGSSVSGTVAVTAVATDDVGVSEVRFLVDGTPIGSDTTDPHATSWDTTTFAEGPRVLTAVAVDAAGNSATSPPATVTVSNPVSLSALGLSPSTVLGGDPSTGTVTLTSAAPAGGVTVSLAGSDPAVASVPASVTVPEGATTATFPISTATVSEDSSATISATVGGTTRTATLTVTAPASTTDTVSISRAEYDADDDELEVRASSSDLTATLSVHVTGTGELIGTMSSGRGHFSWPTNPQNITVRSSLGGSATSGVGAG